MAAPVAKTDGSLLSLVEQPEGQRSAVLFTYAEGDQPGDLMEGQARLFGRAAANVHSASDDFTSQYQRFRLDLSHLIDEPLAKTLPFLDRRPEDQRYLQDFAARVRERLIAVQSELEVGPCHGDLHGMNAAFDQNGRVVMFDFDCGGLGWRSYDIAVYRWFAAQRNKDQNWKMFLEGYQASRPLPPVDLETVPLFVAVRCLWILGLHIGNSLFLGRGWINNQYFDYWFNFIRDWEGKELKPAKEL